MRILEVIPQLSSGGGERFTVDLCNELSKSNDLLLLVFYPLDNSSKSFFLNQVSKKVRIISLKKKLGMDFSIISDIRKIVKKFRPDIIHTHLGAITYVALATVGLNSISYFHTIHSDAEKETENTLGSIIRKILFKSKRFRAVTISTQTKQSFRQYYKVESDLIFNGRSLPSNLQDDENVKLEFDSYRKNGKRVLVNLANFSNVKRQNMIARICKRLESEGYKFSMLLVGRNDKENIMDDIRDLNCESVKVLGAKQDPLQYLVLADGYCLMSSYEGMPISLIEALGCGAVPICTPVGGIVDVIINGENGILSPSIAEDDCYKTIKLFLELTENKILEMREKALNTYKSYSMEKCANNYIKIFRKK